MRCIASATRSVEQLANGRAATAKTEPARGHSRRGHLIATLIGLQPPDRHCLAASARSKQQPGRRGRPDLRAREQHVSKFWPLTLALVVTEDDRHSWAAGLKVHSGTAGAAGCRRDDVVVRHVGDLGGHRDLLTGLRKR